MVVVKTILAIAGLIVFTMLLVSDLGSGVNRGTGYSPRKTDLRLDKPDKWEPKDK